MKISVLVTGFILATSSAAWKYEITGSGDQHLSGHGGDYTSGKCVNLKSSYTEKTKKVSWSPATDWIRDPKKFILYEKDNCEYYVTTVTKGNSPWTPKQAQKVRSYQIVR